MRPRPSESEPDTGGGPALFDFETDAGLGTEAPASPDVAEDSEPLGPEDSDEFEELGPATDEQPARDVGDEETHYDDPEPDGEPRRDPTDEKDLLAESPEFADDGTDEEDLWFEKGPPKDFDFEDEK